MRQWIVLFFCLQCVFMGNDTVSVVQMRSEMGSPRSGAALCFLTLILAASSREISFPDAQEQERRPFACSYLQQKQPVETPLSDQTRTWPDRSTSATHISTCLTFDWATVFCRIHGWLTRHDDCETVSVWTVNMLLYTLCTIYYMCSWVDVYTAPAVHCVCTECVFFCVGSGIFVNIFNTSKSIVSFSKSHICGVILGSWVFPLIKGSK